MKYPVFLQALALTIVVFLIGMMIGISLEENRMQKINDYYVESEVSLLDVLALQNSIELGAISCDKLKSANYDLLNRIYDEAILLESYEESGRITNNLEMMHKKYDILRTHLWINAIEMKEVCGDDFNTLVYLYNNSVEDLTIKAEQNVWSKVLRDVKDIEGENVLLVPIDVGADLISLNSLLDNYEGLEYPLLIINEGEVVNEIITADKIIGLLK